jgi:hypothetical protein
MFFAVVGCGRLGFDALAGDASASDASRTDAIVGLEDWPIFFPSTGQSIASGLALVGDDVWVTVKFERDLTVGSSTEAIVGTGGGAVLRVTRDGTVESFDTYHGDLFVDFRNIAATPDGNLFVTGLFSSTATFGTLGLRDAGRSQDAILLELAPGGEALRLSQFPGDAQNAQGADIAIAADRVVIGGLYTQDIDLGLMTVPDARGDNAAFAGFFDLDHAPIAQYWADSGGNDFTWAVDARGTTACFAARIESGADDGSGAIPVVSGGGDGLLVSFDLPAGAPSYRVLTGVENNGSFTAVAVDDAGRCYGAGSQFDSIDLGMGPIPTRGGADAFVVALDSAGNPRWGHSFGGMLRDRLSAATVRGDTLYVVGSFEGDIDVVGTPLSSAGMEDALVAAFDTATGELRWARRFGGAGNERIDEITIAADGSIYLAGAFDGVTDIDGATASASGSLEAFVHRFVP